MKLLMVSAYLPSLSSAAGERNYHFLKALAQRHSVALVSLVDGAMLEADDVRPYLDELAALASPVRLIPHTIPRSKRWQQVQTIARGKSYLLNLFALDEMQATLDEVFARDRYDAVLFESVLIADYRLPAGMKTIIDQHNVEHELLQRTYEQQRLGLRRWYNWSECRLVKRAEVERCRTADLVVVTSERERLIMRDLVPDTAIEVVRTGLDVETYGETYGALQAPHQIVFTGTMNYFPNMDAVFFFAQECWPRIREQVPDATWQIVGRNPSPEMQKLAEQQPGITVTGAVPDVRPYLAASAVAIAPLRIGSGTRVKILEAFAMRKAVVSTTPGYQGLEVESGKHLLIADQPEAFAQAVVDLLRDPSARAALGTAGRTLVEEEYSWAQSRARLVHLLDRFDTGSGYQAAIRPERDTLPSTSAEA